MWVSPWATAPNKASRCEIDLSPGKAKRPRNFRAGRIVKSRRTLACGLGAKCLRERILTLLDGACYGTRPAEPRTLERPVQQLMKSADARTVRLDIASRIEMLDMVQAVLNHLCGVVGFNEEAIHYMSV